MERLELSAKEDSDEIAEIDQSVWECLGDKVDDILDDNYISAQAPLAAPGNLIDVTLARKNISAK